MSASERCPAPVFITGTQRSGTTLLHQVLESSAAIWSRNELYPVHDWVFGADTRKNGERLKSDLSRLLKLDLSDSPSPASHGDKIAFLDRTLQRFAENSGKSRWCLKDPRITYFLAEYCEQFPNRKMVILIRDPRAVCRSYLDTRGYQIGRPANWIVAAERWTKEVEMQLDASARFPDQIRLVKYEALITQFESEVERICGFIDTPFTEELRSYFTHRSSIKMHVGNENIRKPPDPAMIDKWRRSMSPQQIKTVEAIAFKTMRDLGYDPDYPPSKISRTRRTIARAHDQLVNELRWQASKFQK